MTQITKSALSANKNTSQNPGTINIIASRSATLSEVDILLSELLPQISDAHTTNVPSDGAVPYSKLRRETLGNGIKAVRLPDGRHIARALDRKSGRIFWTFVRG